MGGWPCSHFDKQCLQELMKDLPSGSSALVSYHLHANKQSTLHARYQFLVPRGGVNDLEIERFGE